MIDDIPVEQTPEQAFALMLHDRIVELERKMARMEHKDRGVDPRIKFVEKKRFPLLKIHLENDDVNLSRWLNETVGAVGRATGQEAFGVACKEYNVLAKAYVIECVLDVECDGKSVATAALEHAPSAKVVEVHDVANFTWFSESIAACSYCSSTYDPKTQTVKTVAEPVPEVSGESDTPWLMLNGWLTSVIEGVDISHTRAYDAFAALMHLRGM
jgi:hypothetical protein